jgi:hypothetical protein
LCRNQRSRSTPDQKIYWRTDTYNAPETIKVTQKGETLLIAGDGTSSSGNVIISDSVVSNSSGIFGNIFSSKSNVEIHGKGNVIIASGKKIRVDGDNVWVDGKLVSGDGKDMPAPKPTIVSLPDGVSLSIIGCHDTKILDSCSYKVVVLETKGMGKLETKGLICEEMTLVTSGQSTAHLDIMSVKHNFSLQSSGQSTCNLAGVLCKTASLVVSGTSDLSMDSLKGIRIDITVSGTADVKIKHTDIEKAQFVTSGQSTLKVEGVLTEVVANASGQSTCKFSTSRNHPFIKTSGMATCKQIN